MAASTQQIHKAVGEKREEKFEQETFFKTKPGISISVPWNNNETFETVAKRLLEKWQQLSKKNPETFGVAPASINDLRIMLSGKELLVKFKNKKFNEVEGAQGDNCVAINRRPPDNSSQITKEKPESSDGCHIQ